MSDKKTLDVEILPYEASVTINVSGIVLARIQAFLSNFFPYKNAEHPKEIAKNIMENTNLDDPHVYHFQTLMGLAVLIEEEARRQNKLKTIKIDADTGQPIEEENQPAPQSPEQSESPDSTLP
jgi:hypothetical protein